jgi:hypothetical protein
MPYLEYVKKNIVAMNTGGKELHKMGYKGIFYLDNEKKDFIITESNLEAALVAAGTTWNSDAEWYDDTVYCPLDSAGNVREFDPCMKADSILLTMCYKSNKAREGFSLFSEGELGLKPHTLKAMRNGRMFYEWFAPFRERLSGEGKALYDAMLAVYRFYFRHFGVNADLNVGLNELKLSLMQGRVNATAEKRCFDTSITGNNNGSRIGENSKWTPQKADRQYGVTVCMDYDRALVSLMTLQYRRFIEYGMIDGMCSCVR